MLVLALSGALAYAAARLIAGHPTQQRLADTAKPEGVVMQRVESPQQARQAAEPQASRGPSEGDTDPVGYEAPMGEMEAIAEMPFWEMAPDEGQQLRDRQVLCIPVRSCDGVRALQATACTCAAKCADD